MDDRIRLAALHWNLRVGERLAGGTRSAVHAATDEFGRDLVLKLPEARTAAAGLTSMEAAALRAWERTGAAVTLVDATPDALLLVRARPGTIAPWRSGASSGAPVSGSHGDELIGVAAELLRRLWAAEPGRYRFPSLADVYREDERVAREDAAYERRVRGEPERGAAGLNLLPAATSAAAGLISTITAPTLLHGDFITKNLVRDDASPAGWVALDPLPMIGDPACEVAAFAAYQPAELILPIAEALAAHAGVDRRRVLGWAAIWAVHQSAQAWRQDQDALDRLVESPMITGLLRHWSSAG